MSEEHELRETAAAYDVEQASEQPVIVVEAGEQPSDQDVTGFSDSFNGLTGRARSLANLRPIPPGVSLNPAGRPRGTLGFAQRIQERTRNGEDLLDIALEIAHSKKEAAKDRLRAVEFLANRAFGQAVSIVSVISEQEIERKALEAGVDPEVVKQHLRAQQGKR